MMRPMTQKAEEPKEAPPPPSERDSPLLDLSDPSVKSLIKSAKARGYVTYDELNAVLPGDVTSEQIEDIMAMFSEMGINVVDGGSEEQEAGRRRPRRGGRPGPRAAKCARQGGDARGADRPHR